MLTKQIEIPDERSGSTGRSLAIDETSNEKSLPECIGQNTVGLFSVVGIAAVDVSNRALAGSIVDGQLLLASLSGRDSNGSHGEAKDSSDSELHFERLLED
ncbi:CCCH zinc finger and SMR domain protein [Aspergillus luchuensis]|uniref:CCCH zinc finger and SMR domain protein n=1 Tax=Aspergillus kawachii TaxID=1069201 RepID=A0A146F4U9_ASPKA|nr:CCCH zinc finger and SMR domain protein [Aspergillus luchuensis]